MGAVPECDVAFGYDLMVVVRARWAECLTGMAFMKPGCFDLMDITVPASLAAGGYQTATQRLTDNGDGERRTAGEGTIR
jgi:hypothetical protein